MYYTYTCIYIKLGEVTQAMYYTYVTGFEKRDLIAHFEKIELLLP